MSKESNLVKHARRELDLVGEDPIIVEKTIEIVKIFDQCGHSGASAAFHIAMISTLLSYKPLSPITDNPDEWFFHAEDVAGTPGGFWQNMRDGEAFSGDGGKTYYLLREGGHSQNPNNIMHDSAPHNKE